MRRMAKKRSHKKNSRVRLGNSLKSLGRSSSTAISSLSQNWGITLVIPYLVALVLTLICAIFWHKLMLVNLAVSIIPFGILACGKCRGAFRPSKWLWLFMMAASKNAVVMIISFVLFVLMLRTERTGIPVWDIPDEAADPAQDIMAFMPIGVLGVPQFWRRVEFFKTNGNVIVMANKRWFWGESLQNMASCCDPECPTNPLSWILLGTATVVIKYHEDKEIKELKVRLPYPVARDAARNQISVLIDKTCSWQGVKRLGHA